MANMMTSDMFECDICYEKYEERGKHVPLVLPCGHTYCEECVASLQSRSCPACNFPLQGEQGGEMVFPRNNWIVRCLLLSSSSSSSSSVDNGGDVDIPVARDSTGKKAAKSCGCAPKVAVMGQRVLFKQLDRAVNPSPTYVYSSEAQRLERERQRREERTFLINLSRICREKKAKDPSFDQKRFVKHGLFMKFGEVKAKAILSQVYSRLKERKSYGTGIAC
jgi:hypothetical protein